MDDFENDWWYEQPDEQDEQDQYDDLWADLYAERRAFLCRG